MTRIITILMAACCAMCSMAQLTAEKCFREAPNRVLPLIDPTTRLDMLDYYEARSPRASVNNYGGPCRIDSITPTWLSYEGTEEARYQLFVLNPMAPKPYTAIIETLATPIADSNMIIYDNTWQLAPAPARFTRPTLSDWLTPEGQKHRTEVEDAIPFIMADYTYNPYTQTLTITNNMCEYFHSTDTPAALSYLRNALEYKWDGRKFTLTKP